MGPCGKAVGSGGWKGRWETPEKLKNGVRLGGRCCRARSRSPPPLVLGEGKQGAGEDGGKPRGFTWMVLMFSVSGMGEEASHIAPWYGGSSTQGGVTGPASDIFHRVVGKEERTTLNSRDGPGKYPCPPG